MSSPEVELRGVWGRLVGASLPAAPSVGHSPATDHLLEALLSRLREPHRRYHTAVHVMWVLRHVQSLAHLLGGPEQLFDVQLAAVYHDAVYDPRRTDNEATSADLGAAVAAELGWEPQRCHRVHRLVMATAGHRPRSTDEAVLIDADLAVLGGDARSYSAYVAGIRAEYAHVDEQGWQRGRTEVLHRFLDAEHVFHTVEMRSTREARARANMAAELAALQQRR